MQVAGYFGCLIYLGMLVQGSGAGLCLPAVVLSAVAGGISLEVSPASDDVKARARPSLAPFIGWLLFSLTASLSPCL